MKSVKRIAKVFFILTAFSLSLFSYGFSRPSYSESPNKIIEPAEFQNVEEFELLFLNKTQLNDQLLTRAIVGDIDDLSRLLKLGANVNAKGNAGWTALHIASLHGNKKMVQLLLDNNADVNARDEKLQTPLHLASYEGYTEVVQLLIDNKADINAKDEDGWTALHWASYEDDTEMVYLLIDNNINLNTMDKYFRTALDLAEDSWNTQTAWILKKEGAKKSGRLYKVLGFFLN